MKPWFKVFLDQKDEEMNTDVKIFRRETLLEIYHEWLLEQGWTPPGKQTESEFMQGHKGLNKEEWKKKC